MSWYGIVWYMYVMGLYGMVRYGTVLYKYVVVWCGTWGDSRYQVNSLYQPVSCSNLSKHSHSLLPTVQMQFRLQWTTKFEYRTMIPEKIREITNYFYYIHILLTVLVLAYPINCRSIHVCFSSCTNLSWIIKQPLISGFLLISND